MLNFAFRRSWSPQAQVSLHTTLHPKATRHLQPLGVVLLWAAVIPLVKLTGCLLLLWSTKKQVERGRMNSPVM